MSKDEKDDMFEFPREEKSPRPDDIPQDVFLKAQDIHMRFINFKTNDVECVVEIARAIIAGQRSKAACDVLAERQRQVEVEVEGWNAARDDKQTSSNLTMASVSYALASTGAYTKARLDYIMFKYWPLAFVSWKPKDNRRDKVRAAALMLAAIEHEDRAAAKEIAS